MEFACFFCGKVERRYYEGTRLSSGFCSSCYSKHAAEQRRAVNAVNAAVKRGRLQRAATCQCTDCGKPATEYDHRDYTKPLDVDPVCRPCNHKRGSAFNSFWRPQQEPAAQPS